MFQFLTTYRKDYTWPFVRSLALRPVPVGLKYSSTPDPKGPPGPKYMTYEEYQDLVEERNRCLRESGQLPQGGGGGGRGAPGAPDGRMPAIASKASNPCQMSPDQVNVTAQHLKELQEKHPYLFNVFKSCPPDDLINRVFNDRYRSVYMVDYGREAEYPNLDYDKLVEYAGLGANQGLAFCPCRDAIKSKYPQDSTGIVSAVNRGQKNECDALAVHKPERREAAEDGGEVCLCGQTMDVPRYGRYATISRKDRAAEEFLGGSKSGGTRGGGGGSWGGGEGGSWEGRGVNKGGGSGGGGVRRAKIYKLTYNTEYNDAFGKLGEFIINSRLHARGVPGNAGPIICP